MFEKGCTVHLPVPSIGACTNCYQQTRGGRMFNFFPFNFYVTLDLKHNKHCKRKKQQTWGKLSSMYGGNLKRNLCVNREGLPPVRCQILRKLFSTVRHIFTFLHCVLVERVYHHWSDFRFRENFSDQSLRRNSITNTPNTYHGRQSLL